MEDSVRTLSAASNVFAQQELFTIRKIISVRTTMNVRTWSRMPAPEEPVSILRVVTDVNVPLVLSLIPQAGFVLTPEREPAGPILTPDSVRTVSRV